MYVITVSFEIKKDFVRAFRLEMVANAQASLQREPGCRQFDVCLDPTDDTKVFLYELYNSRDAFDAHLASDHFIRFNQTTASWVAAKKVLAMERVFPSIEEAKAGSVGEFNRESL